MLKQRVLTALVLLPVFLIGLFVTSPAGFSVFIAAVIAIGAWEWARLGGLQTEGLRIAFASGTLLSLLFVQLMPIGMLMTLAAIFWSVAALMVITWPDARGLWSRPAVRLISGWLALIFVYCALVYLRESEGRGLQGLDGRILILYVFLVVWAADVGAYFAGRRYGRRKLAPAVSPGKSVEGVIGGLAAVSLLPLITAFAADLTPFQWLTLWVISLVVTCASVVGDLFESLAKRQAGVKDSSRILPGHGGIMDRIDSITAAAPVMLFLLLLLEWLPLIRDSA